MSKLHKRVLICGVYAFKINFKDDVSKHLKSIPRIHLLPKLLSVSSFMARWGKNFFHKCRNKIKKQEDVFSCLINRFDEEGVGCYFKEKRRSDDLLL